MKRDNQFLKKNYLKNLWPITLSVLGGTLNALIDSAFVSQRLGSSSLAAVNMSMPVYLIICTFGSLIVGGASVMSAFDAGREDMRGAEKHYRAAFMCLMILGTVISVLGVVFCHPIVTLIAQGSELVEYVEIYCFVTFAGAVPLLLIYLPTYYLQLEGKMREIYVMMGLIIGVDVLFDWLMLYVFDAGLGGAALASLISTVTALTYGLKKLESDTSNYHFKLQSCSVRELRDMIKYGSPTALNNLIDAVKLVTLNALILFYGGTGAAAIWAVLNSLSEFSLSYISGVPQAAAPMQGAYHTSHENSSLRILINLQVRSGLILSASYMVIIMALSPLIRGLFVISESMLLPLLYLGVYCILDMPASVWCTFFQCTGRIAESNLLIICRKYVFPTASILLLCLLKWDLFLFLPISGALTLLLGVAMTEIVRARSKKGDHPLSKLLLLDDWLERNNKVIDFSILPTADNICSASEQISDFCRMNDMSSKLTMRLRLAIEEVMTVIAEKNSNSDSVDLRAFATGDGTGIRIRYTGDRYDPFDSVADEDSVILGVAMIRKMAKNISYTYSLGMNTVNILFENTAKQEKPND